MHKYALISFSYPHHGKYSSYTKLADSLEGYVDYLRRPLLSRRLVSCGLKKQYFYFKLISFGLSRAYRRYDIIHHIYPETSFVDTYANPYLKRTIFTVHQPVAELIRRKDDRRLKHFFRCLPNVGCAISLTRKEATVLAATFGCRTEFIRHGVDIDHFRPSESAERRKIVLTVGNWLRDWMLWAKVVNVCAARDKDLLFVVVGNPSREARIAVASLLEMGRVQIKSLISDENLLHLYHVALAQFLPLLESTANNAVLESMACGVPLVGNRQEAFLDYTPESARFLSDDPIEVAETLIRLARDRNMRKEAGAGARKFAAQILDWRVVSEKILALYADQGVRR